MLTADEVLKVAKLANLKLAESDLPGVAKDLSGVLDHINQLNKLDTSGVPPTSHILEMGNVFRDDAVTAMFDPKLSLENAPAPSRGFFSVPRIIE